jgi:hypothetical protein
MYRLSAAIITALFFIAPTKSHSQITPVWFTLLTPAQQSLTKTVSLPAGPTYRIGDSENDKWSAPVTTRPKQRIDFQRISLLSVASAINFQPSWDFPDPLVA